MHFLPDVFVPCEVCKGHRYNRETLEVRYKGKNIFEVLDMTVSEGVEFFANIPKIYNKLKTSIIYVFQPVISHFYIILLLFCQHYARLFI